jgi:hypothetical protein
MDFKREVLNNYKLRGIPAKFVIDENGKIRFRSSGFGGSDESAVDELSIMIDITKEKSAKIPGMVATGEE